MNKIGQAKIITGALISLGTSFCLCFAGLAVLSYMISTQRIGEGGGSIGISLLLAISVLVGGQVLYKNAGTIPVISLINAIMMTAIMLIGSLLIDGEFRNGLINIGSITFGGLLSFTICLKSKGKGRRIKKHYR